MDLKVGDVVLTNQQYDDFFGYIRSGIVKYIQHCKYVNIKCNDNVLRIIHIDWLKKLMVIKYE